MSSNILIWDARNERRVVYVICEDNVCQSRVYRARSMYVAVSFAVERIYRRCIYSKTRSNRRDGSLHNDHTDRFELAEEGARGL